MSTPLKHALIDDPNPAWKIAQKAGISDVRLSNMARGRARPTDVEKQRISNALASSVPVEELFPEEKPEPVEAA